MKNGGRSIGKAIAVGTAVCGTLDIADALIFYWLRAKVAPEALLHNIAAALLGRQTAAAGGWGTALVGLAIHYCIAATWVTLFVLLAQRVRGMFRYAAAAGAVYGLVVYFVMNYVVLPLTRVPPRSHPTGVVLVNAVGALVTFMGVLVGLVNRRYAPGPEGWPGASRR